MQIKINGLNHELDINAALAAGVLKRNLRKFTIELDENEIAALYAITSKIGGSPDQSARGYINTFRDKLYALNTDFKCDRSLNMEPLGGGLYFQNSK